VYYRDFYYDRQWTGEAEDSAMTRINVTLTREELRKKLAAFSEYKSQISDLFDTQARLMSYFAETGKDESFFLPQQADASHLAMLWSVLTRDATL
jgi:hypothetical protein